MELDARSEIAADHARVVGALEDLSTYPHWLTIVGAAAPASPHPEDEGKAWQVELVGRLGPFRRTKRVRMVRTRHDPAAGAVRFERVEHDGGDHHAWILTAEAEARTADRTAVHVHLHYGGSRSLPGADLLLRQEAQRAGERLDAYLRDLG